MSRVVWEQLTWWFIGRRASEQATGCLVKSLGWFAIVDAVACPNETHVAEVRRIFSDVNVIASFTRRCRLVDPNTLILNVRGPVAMVPKGELENRARKQGNPTRRFFLIRATRSLRFERSMHRPRAYTKPRLFFRQLNMQADGKSAV